MDERYTNAMPASWRFRHYFNMLRRERAQRRNAKRAQRQSHV
ncbi:MAG: hypothetical protein V4449_01040 [Patescibacteria group bacterium]